MAQDKVGVLPDGREFDGIVLDEERVRERAVERSRGVTRERIATQENIAYTLSVLADLLRTWDRQTRELRASIWAESRNDPAFTPSSMSASVSARPGGELMKSVPPEDLAILQSICTVIGAAHRMAQR